jgi:hypothetical protein
MSSATSVDDLVAQLRMVLAATTALEVVGRKKFVPAERVRKERLAPIMMDYKHMPH